MTPSTFMKLTLLQELRGFDFQAQTWVWYGVVVFDCDQTWTQMTQYDTVAGQSRLVMQVSIDMISTRICTQTRLQNSAVIVPSMCGMVSLLQI